MTQAFNKKRVFLFLQGPHGPFFNRLGKMLRAAGCETWRVGFNAGDRAFWFQSKSFIPFTDTQDQWIPRFNEICAEKSITDIVLYGDTRKIHSDAISAAKQAGITVHVFEEGYMRPYWVTYERDGTNGNSRLMNMSVSEMQTALENTDPEVPPAPPVWGDMRQHIFYGALYHWFVMFRNGTFRNFKPHRELPVAKEFGLYFKRLMLMPAITINRKIATMRIKYGGFPYHLALMQLEHDSSFQNHSPFTEMREFLDVVMQGFASGAPQHHHLVFKAHPLENGRTNVRQIIRDLSKEYGIDGRVHYVRGGKMAQLLRHTRTAVTVNSTAAQQVLWRGIPLKVFGTAVYSKPEFVSTQGLSAFFALPSRPNRSAYKDYRRFLLETSQVAGGFYSARGRRALMRQVVDLMISHEDPYDALITGTATPRQQLSVVS